MTPFALLLIAGGGMAVYSGITGASIVELLRGLFAGRQAAPAGS